MPEGNRLAGYAIVAILLLAIFVAYSLGRIDSPQRAESEARNQHACREGDYARCDTKPIILEPSGEQRPADPYEKANRDEYRSESDLAAQWAMAKWARLASIASFIGIVLLFVTWHATAQGVRETKRVGEAQARAYLGIRKFRISYTKEPLIKLTDDEHESATFTGVIELENSGNSPARNTKVAIALAECIQPMKPEPPFKPLLRVPCPPSIHARSKRLIDVGFNLNWEQGRLKFAKDADVSNQNRRFYVVGRIEFTDVFDIVWESFFSFVAVPFFLEGEFDLSTMKFRPGDDGFYTDTDFSIMHESLFTTPVRVELGKK